MKKIIAFCFLILPVTSTCFGQTNQTRSLTVQTYYPAPVGVYSSLRFKPSSVPTGTNLQPGVIYFDNAANILRYYNKTNTWVNLTPGGGGPYWELNNTTKVLRNINAGKVIIDGAAAGGPNATAFRIYGEPRINGKDGNSTLYLSRESGSTNVSQRMIFHTTSVTNRSWVLGSYKNSIWPYSPLILGQVQTNDLPFYHVTVRDDGNIGIRANSTQPFFNSSAKLHIVSAHNGTDAITEMMLLDGNGKIGVEISAASNNTTFGPVIRSYRSRGTLASPVAVGDEDELFGMIPQGYFSGGWYKNSGSMGISAFNTFNATSTPGHISFYGTNTTATDYEMKLCIIQDGCVSMNYDTWWDWQLHVCGNPSCSGGGGLYNSVTWTTSSDGRYKKNISGIEDALEKILRAKGIRYDSTTEKSSIAKNGRHFGFIGQDLEVVMPELVDTDPKGYKSVWYSGITPVLVEAIKDQQEQIEYLRHEVGVLKALEKQGAI